MNDISRKHLRFRSGAIFLSGLLLLAPLTATDGWAQESATAPPPLIITNEPLPESLKRQIYSKPVQVREIKTKDVTGQSYFKPTQTLVTRKVHDLTGELGTLQRQVAGLSATLNGIQKDNEFKAAEYYAAVATVNTQLQSGTTPGNPRLLEKLSKAESNLENLGTSVAHLNQLSVDAAQTASEASFLLEETRAAYSLSGAIEEDHVQLAELEDTINNTIVIIERVLNNVNDDITRTSTYLSSERNNMRTLSLAVSNGDLYGKSLSNRPFSSASAFDHSGAGMASVSPASHSTSTALSGPRPLVKIRFDRPDVDYQQPVYMAVNEALERYPDARFDLVAVHPTHGNAAQVAIESTRARRNAERVLRTLTQMGLPLERVDLSYSTSDEAATNEVHLFIR